MRRLLKLCALVVFLGWGLPVSTARAGVRASLLGRDTGPVVSAPAPPGRSAVATDTTADWTRFDWDAQRSGVSTAATGIDAGNVGTLHRQQIQLDGTVDASAIFLHDVQVGAARHDALFVTTTYGKTEAIDASSGDVLWRYTPPGYDAWAGSRQVTTATPVADPDRSAVYAATPGGEIVKLRVADGHVEWRTAVTKLPHREKIASALNLFDGKVLATTGGYIGDRPPYQGHVAVIDAASGRLLHVWNALCSDRSGVLEPSSCSESGAAIWGRAGAVVDTTSGNLFVATGDGRWDGRTYWGDAIVELDPDATRMLGNYTPASTAELDRRDRDLGSTSPVLLGGGRVAQGGKDDVIRLLDWSKMKGTSPHRGGEVEAVATPSGSRVFTEPVVWHRGATTWLFVTDEGGTGAWTVSEGRLQQKWTNSHRGTSPVLAGGLLYVYDQGGGGIRVYEPTSGRLVGVLDCGSGHWNSPIVVDGMVVLPEGNSNRHATRGILDIWRLP